MNRFVISVLSANRIGLFSDVSSTIANAGGNIDGLSQTVAEGYFTMLLTASFALENTSKDDFCQELATKLEKNVDRAIVLPFDPKSKPENSSASRYIITMIGKDRQGLLAMVTGMLEEKNIAVTDWYIEFQGASVVHIGEIVIPASLDVKDLQNGLLDMLSGMGLSCRIQHNNIFRATNEIGPIKSLVEESRHA